MNEIFSEAEKASMDNVIKFPGEMKPAPAEPSDVDCRSCCSARVSCCW